MNRIRTCKAKPDLASIKEPETELVIWQRSLPLGLQNWIDQIDAANLPDARVLVKPTELRAALEPFLDRCGLNVSEMRNQLVTDINSLVIEFSTITQSDYVDVRLERVNHDACWKFHRDNVKTRLVTTYRGPTTEWVKQAQSEQAICEQREFKGPLERLGNGDVAIFKGSFKNPKRGIVHRSPPIGGTGVTRLLLCLNQQTAASPHAWNNSEVDTVHADHC